MAGKGGLELLEGVSKVKVGDRILDVLGDSCPSIISLSSSFLLSLVIPWSSGILRLFCAHKVWEGTGLRISVLLGSFAWPPPVDPSTAVPVHP